MNLNKWKVEFVEDMGCMKLVKSSLIILIMKMCFGYYRNIN